MSKLEPLKANIITYKKRKRQNEMVRFQEQTLEIAILNYIRSQ